MLSFFYLSQWNALQHLLEYCYYFYLVSKPKTCAYQPFFHLSSLLHIGGRIETKFFKRWQHYCKYCNSNSFLRGWRHGAKTFSRFVLFFADVIKISSLEKIKKIQGDTLKMLVSAFQNMFYFCSNTYTIWVELLTILVGHPVYVLQTECLWSNWRMLHHLL